MSDESAVEKFVLQYTVDSEETIKRLEELSNKIDEIHDKGKKEKEDGVGGLGGKKGKEFRDFLQGTTRDLDELVPGLDKATSTVTKYGKGVAIATIAMASFALVLRSVMELSKEYELQRITGAQVGLTPGNVNNLQQQFSAANGRMTGDKSRDLMTKVAGMTSASYVNPDPWNREALQLRNAGVNNVRGQDGKIKSTMTVLDEMTKKFQSVSQAQAEAIGMSIGLTLDETKAIRERNLTAQDSLAMSASAIARQGEANASMEKLGESSGHLSERWRQVSNIIGQEFVPILAKIVEWVDSVTSGLPEALDVGLAAMHKFNNQFAEGMKWLQDAPQNIMRLGDSWDEHMKAADDRTAQQIAQGKKQAEQNQNTADQSYKTQKEFERNVNLFASSVGAFSGVIDERQAWASWAGSVGAAGGLTGLGQGAPGAAAASGGGNGNQFGGYSVPPTNPGTVTGYGNKQNPNTDKYDSLLQQIWGKDWQVGKAIMSVESGGDPNAANKKSTARGLMQVLQSQKDFVNPGEDPFDARTSIEQGKRVWDAKMRAAKGDYNKAIMYYGENTPEYLNKVQQYLPRQNVPVEATYAREPIPQSQSPSNTPLKPENMPKPLIHGETRQSAQMNMVADEVAAKIGITRQQLMQPGQTAKSDISYAIRNLEMEAGKKVQIAQAQVNAPGLLERQRAQAAIDLRNANMELDNLKTYGNTILGRGYGKEDDKRVLTDQRPDMTMNFYITGVDNPQSFGQKVVPQMKEAMKDVVNTNNTVVKS